LERNVPARRRHAAGWPIESISGRAEHGGLDGKKGNPCGRLAGRMDQRPGKGRRDGRRKTAAVRRGIGMN
jgi:hypothetical protein